MKKKVLAVLIMAGMMTMPSVVQATERIDVNRLCRQDICKTSMCIGDKFLNFVCQNLNTQTKKCFLNNPVLLNDKGDVCVSNCNNYSCDTSKTGQAISKDEQKPDVENQNKQQVNNAQQKQENNSQNNNSQNSDKTQQVNKSQSKEGKLTADYKKAVNAKMVQLVNELRASQGVAALKSIDTLNNLAEKRSEYMAQTGEFSHYDKNGNFIFKDDLDKVNYSWRSVGENIVQNYYYEDPNKLAEELFTQWKNSSGHYKNMVNPDFNQIGFGIAISNDGKVYGTQGFVGK